jgi:diaminopimelate decarboxylase
VNERRSIGTKIIEWVRRYAPNLDEVYGDAPRDHQPVTLAGPTCDSVDVVARDYPLPPLQPGDVVVSPMMGAYTTVTSSRFNGIAETPIVVSRGSTHLGAVRALK